MTKRPLLYAAAFVGAMLEVRLTRADVPELELAWEAPDGCPSAAQVSAGVARLLGGAERKQLGTRIRASVVVRGERDGRWTADLDTVTESGRGLRSLEGESCTAIASATSVILAFAIDPEAALQNADVLRAPEPVQERAPPDPAPAPPEEPRPEPMPEGAEPSPYARLSFGVAFELLSEPAVVLELAAGARSTPWNVEILAGYYQPRSVLRADRPEVGAELRLYTVSALGCLSPAHEPAFLVQLCGGVELEHLSARSFGITDPDSDSELLWAFAGGLRANLRATSWLSTVFEARVTARPFHPEFVIHGVGAVFDVPVFAPLLASGLELEF